jgi:uncharacterized protein YmfQ (DUF2313 family)
MTASLSGRTIQHLLPRSGAWSLTQNKMLRKFFAGLAGFFDDAANGPKAFVDSIWFDVLPSTARTSALAEWEREFGLPSDPSDSVRRLALAAAWRATGGQSPSYIQGVLQAAGFNVYVHEWWSSGPPFVARDPRTYTLTPQIGTYQCAPVSLVEYACAPRILNQPQCNDFLGNDPGYLVNKDLTRRPPPPVPNDPATWPYFLYIGAASFPTHANVAAARRDEFERLILKLRPTQHWIVTLINYV